MLEHVEEGALGALLLVSRAKSFHGFAAATLAVSKLIRL
jgi:hypothetical protein